MGALATPFSGDGRHYLEQELDELVQQKKIWQFLRGGSLDGVWYWDLEEPDNEWMSPEFWALLGIDHRSRRHDPSEWQDLIHPDDLQTATENFVAHCDDPKHPYDQIVRYRHADGSTVWVRCRGLAIRSRDGTPIRMLGTHNDVTALKLAEERALHDRGVAAHANEELQAFAYSTSHDLKSPANTIRMLLQEMRHALNSGDFEDIEFLLGKAETTNEAMRTLVDKLLEYTRMIGTESQHEAVDLDALLAEVVQNLEADITASGAQVSIGPLGSVSGVAWQLGQMFQNLIANAIKFQSAGGSPSIQIAATQAPAGRVKVEVTDNGIGVAPEDRKRIFELFSKLHRPSAYQGSGVGLALCNRVARAHGSTIDVRASESGGTVFSLSLPRVQTKPKEQ